MSENNNNTGGGVPAVDLQQGSTIPVSPAENTPSSLLLETFRKHGTPLSIDIKPLQDLDDIMSDPAVTSVLDSIPNLQIMTDTQMRSLITQTGEPDYMNVVADLRSQRRYGERTEYMESFTQSFMTILKKVDPNLHDHLAVKIETNALQEHENFSSLHGHPLERYRTLTAFEQIKKLESSYSVNHFDATDTLPALHLLKVADQSFDKDAHMSDPTGMRKHTKTLALIQNPPPGTDQEWAAMINMHEIAHLAGDSQQTSKNAFQAVTLGQGEGPLDRNVGHSTETDADLDMYAAIGHLVSEDAMEYWAARRIALQSVSHIDHALRQVGDDEAASPDIHIQESHDSGFFLMEYMQTGEVPDYYNTTTSTNSFFEKTMQFAQDTFETAKKAHTPPLNGRVNFEPDQQAVLDAVEQALKSERSLYTPAEQLIAQNYLYAMHTVLGIEKGSLEQSIKTALTNPTLADTELQTGEPSAAGTINTIKI